MCRPEFFLCLDACFAIRRNKDYNRQPGHKKQPGIKDPRIVPPGTQELPRSFLEIWKARVEGAHPGKPATRTSKKGEYALDGPGADDDIVEAGLHIPNSSLNICGKSFITADGDRVKTPGERFSDTGVMAGVCHHDHMVM